MFPHIAPRGSGCAVLAVGGRARRTFSDELRPGGLVEEGGHEAGQATRHGSAFSRDALSVCLCTGAAALGPFWVVEGGSGWRPLWWWW